MKKFIVILLLSFPLVCFSQSQSVDSCEIKIEMVKQKTIQLKNELRSLKKEKRELQENLRKAKLKARRKGNKPMWDV